MYTCPSDRWEWGRGGERKNEKDGWRENGSEEEAEDTDKGRTCVIKIERKIIKQTELKNKATKLIRCYFKLIHYKTQS